MEQTAGIVKAMIAANLSRTSRPAGPILGTDPHTGPFLVPDSTLLPNRD